MTLWAADGVTVDDAILAFTVGDDPILDRALVPYDCLATGAHARMLAAIGVLTGAELDGALAALREVHAESEGGRFEIRPEQEDAHTALEQRLTERVGETGKKIHTGRSRNDQVIMALRLCARERLLGLAGAAGELIDALLAQAEDHRRTLMPGFTHTRQGMPSTAGLFFAAAAEGVVRDCEAFAPALAIASRSALGSASGYGVPLPLDREGVARLLGLDGVDIATLHAQNTRGRLEAATLFALHQLSLTLSRLAADLVELSSEAHGFFRLPQELTTGSSIMPQKRNPDVFELMRAVPSAMLARYTEVTGLLHGLGAGYHRDLQRTKAPLLAGLDEMDRVLRIATLAARRLEVDVERCARALRPEIYATDRALAHVRAGVPFREAYKRVKTEGAEPLSPEEVLAPRTHTGAPGTDLVPPIRRAWDEVRARWTHSAA